jgi:16S rRNA (guanine(966)-N(2))-methyltransferase RsmD
MRIIGGNLGGRKINPPTNMPHTRPTTDLAKEGLFNIIENNFDLESIRTLDLFGGTGSISYELASRGVPDLTVVEKDPDMADFIRKSAKLFQLQDFKVVRQDVFRYLEQCNETFDFIFAGPPYALGTIDKLPGIIISQQILKPKGWFVLEHTPRNAYEQYEGFAAVRKYGTTLFSIFINRTEP